jgi:lipoyl(octanoyl) transferase
MSQRGFITVHKITETDYQLTWQAMQRFTTQRQADTPDQLWIVKHDPVYTLGRNAKPEHLFAANDIPVIQVDRGGQVTYHGPGQAVIYLLLDLKRSGLDVRTLVQGMEQAVIDLLHDLLDSQGIAAHRKAGAPGVYILGKKIAALGLRVRRGCCYHGLSLNIEMDLRPYEQINPCGYKDLEVTQLADWITSVDYPEITSQLVRHLVDHLGYTIGQPQ